MIGKYGRLGNQMFQYATLYSIAKTRGYQFGIPYQNKSDNEYMNLSLDECFDKLSAKDSTNVKNTNVAYENNFTYNAGIFGIPNHTDIIGYFQSEKYFKNYKEQIKQEYSFKDEIYEKCSAVRDLTSNKAISIHLRLGDYKNLQGKHPICSSDYYNEALKLLPDDILIFAFSDEPELAKQLFDSFNKKYVLPELSNQYEDMCLMTLCDYHIIANSSFSWWGSWLSNSKKTIAPAIWFGEDKSMPQNWSDIYCDGWTII